MRPTVYAEESGQLNKEAEKESVEVPTNQNLSKSSNVGISIIYGSLNVNSSSILFPNTLVQNQTFGTMIKPTNALETTNEQETKNEPETTNEHNQQ